MNIFTKIKLKNQIKKLANKNKPYKLYKLVTTSEYDLNEVIDLLNKDEVAVLTKGAMNRLDNDFLIEIAVTSKYANTDQIIKYLIIKFNNKYLDYEYHLSYFIGMHFTEFLNGALQTKNGDLIFYLANHASKEPNKYVKEIKRIKKYYLTYPVNKDTIEIAKLPGFNTPDLENKIIKGSIYLFMQYLNDSNHKEELITKFFKSYPTIIDFKYFLHSYLETPIFNETLEILLHTYLENENSKASYLMQIYAFKPTPDIKAKILPVMLELKNDNLIKNFIETYSETEQISICEKYFDTTNPHILFNLAITTDCPKTYQIIDKIITNYHHLIIPLITKLKNRFLNYALNQILLEKGSNYYLNILYVLIDENNLCYLNLIDFIYKYNYTNLFTPESLKKLASRTKNKQNNSLKK